MTTVTMSPAEELRTTVVTATALALTTYQPPPSSIGEPGTLELQELQRAMADRMIPYDTVRQALQLIAQLGIVFATPNPERAVEALGMVMVHAGVIGTIERMSIRPIIWLAEALRARQDVEPIRATSTLADVVMSTRTQGRMPPSVEMYQVAIVEALALAIAKGIDDCEIGHDLEINPVELYRRMAIEVRDRAFVPASMPGPSVYPDEPTPAQRPGAKPPALPAVPEMTPPRAAAAEQIRRATGELTAPSSAFEATAVREVAQAQALLDAQDELMARAAAGGPFWGDGRHDVAPGDLVGFAQRTAEEQRLGVSAATVCPQCAAPLSHRGDSDVWVCSNRHEIAGQAMAALGGPRPAPEARRPDPVARSGRSFPPPRKP